MLIKMLTLQAGPAVTREPGQVYEVSAKEGKELIDGGYAVEAKREVSVSRATGRRGKEKAVDIPEESADAGGED